MLKRVLVVLVLFAVLLAVSWFVMSNWHREHRLPTQQSGGNCYYRDRPFPRMASEVWKTGADEIFYAISVGHLDFDPNMPAVTYAYSYDVSKGGTLLVNGQRIRWSADRRLLALGPFGDMVEIQLTEAEAVVVAAGDAEKIWETVVLPRLYRFEGKVDEGRRTGHWIYRDVEGRKACEGDYAGGLRDGKWVYLFPSGAVKAEIGYLKGKRNGVWRQLSEDGAVRESLTWKDDVPMERAATQSGLGYTETINPSGSSESTTH